MKLAGAGLGDMEAQTDLAEAEIGGVVEMDDGALTFREACDDGMQGVVAFVEGRLLKGVGSSSGEQTGESERILIWLGRIEREDGSASDLGIELFEFWQGDAESGGEFVMGGWTPQAGFEGKTGFAEVFLSGTDQARRPIRTAERFENGATNEGDGVGLEFDVAGGIEGVYGADETEKASGFEVVAIQRAQRAGRETLDGRRNEVGIALNETGAGLLTVLFPEAMPERSRVGGG